MPWTTSAEMCCCRLKKLAHCRANSRRARRRGRCAGGKTGGIRRCLPARTLRPGMKIGCAGARAVHRYGHLLRDEPFAALD